jgi:D-arginine dehydrogenase
MSLHTEIAVIGAGMAGASLAAELSADVSVIVIEAESQPGYHSTGRSAAFWSETYGGPSVQALTAASGRFLAAPPDEFHEASFLSPRGALSLAREDSSPMLDAMEAEFAGKGVQLERVGRGRLKQLVPGLTECWTTGLLEPGCSDIDVAALHGAYLKLARRRGARVLTGSRVVLLRRNHGSWRIETEGEEVEAEIVVNAAGAWADEVACLAGIPAIGIQPYRRTIAQLRISPPASRHLPLVLDAEGSFYFKPEAGGRLWLSPHDETPCPASDCAPEVQDVAVAIDRLKQVVDWRVDRVEHSWAGLRSFAPDRLPVYGPSSCAKGFFWFAGQGGFGIQTAPAAAKLAASMLLGKDPDLLVAAIDSAPYSPARFEN